MVMGYQAYAGNGLADSLKGGVGVASAYDDLKRRKGLASGFSKVAKGDNSGWAEVAANAPELYMKKLEMDKQGTISPYQQAVLDLKGKEIEQRNNQNTFGVGTAKGETLQAIALLNDPNTPPEIRKQLEQFVNVRTKVPEVVYTTKYQETLGRKQAEKGIQDQTNKQESVIRLNKIDDTIANVEKNKNLLTPTAPVSDFVGALTQGNYGMSDEDRITRGELVRQVSDIKNDLIARAKQHGQSGINTAAEIDRATAGVDSGDYAKLIGALRTLKKYEQKVLGLENGMSMVGTTPEQTQQEIVDYTSYFGGK